MGLTGSSPTSPLPSASTSSSRYRCHNEPPASEISWATENFGAALTRETTAQALADASVTPAELDIVELHDAFTVEELLYIEAMGICEPGHAAAGLEAGDFDIGTLPVTRPFLPR
jgi:acetyl-CoA acetyltransferase